MSGWKPFWFEGNLWWGDCPTSEEWEHVKRIYARKDASLDLGSARRCTVADYDKFGFSVECQGGETLGQWAAANGMDL